jgi:hypothetical protein
MAAAGSTRDQRAPRFPSFQEIIMAIDPGQELSNLNFASLIGGPLCAVVEAQTQAARATTDFIKSVGFDADGNPIYVAFKYPKEVAPYQPAVPAEITITTAGAGYGTTPPTISGEPSPVAAIAEIADGKVVAVTFTGEPNTPVTGPVTLTFTPPNSPANQGDVTAVAVYRPARPAVPAQYAVMQIEVPILTMLPIPFIRVEEATIDFNAKINSVETRSESSELNFGATLEVRQRWPSGSAKLNASFSYQKKTASGSSVERTYSMNIHVRASQDEMPAGMEKLLSLLEGAMKATPLPA